MRKATTELFSFVWIFILIFFLGVTFIVFGIKDLTYTTDNMIIESGTIISLEENETSLLIKLDKYPYKFETTVSTKINTIKSQLNPGDSVSIYRKDEKMFFIQKIVKGETVIIQYKKLIIFSIVLVIFGFGLIYFSFYYVYRKVKQNYGTNPFKF